MIPRREELDNIHFIGRAAKHLMLVSFICPSVEIMKNGKHGEPDLLCVLHDDDVCASIFF